MLKEFREFAIKGNVIDMAVGVVIGAGFGKIVSSLVADIITPVMGLLIGAVDFKELKIVLKEGLDEKSTLSWNYGLFIQAVFDFLLIALAIFFLVKGINRLKRQQPVAPPPPPPPPVEVQLLTEIRDELRSKRAV